MDNLNNPNESKNKIIDNKNTEKNQAVAKSSVKTIYLDASGNMSVRSSVLGLIFIFFCVFAVCIGLVMCVSESFKLELNMPVIFLIILASELFFTLIYFLPSRIFTFLAFLLASGGIAFYIIKHFDYIKDAAYYTLNLGLYRINQEGYIIGGIIDYQLAKTSNAITAGYLNTVAILAGIFFTAIFSYLLYSKKNVIYSLLISVAVVFPGFFYGLIPSYFSFSLVGAFWVSQFSINLFESSHMAYIISRENTIPEKKLEKYKLKIFKKQYNQNIKSIKSEIKTIIKSPNRNENSIRLDRLVRQLNSVTNKEKLFLSFYGLNTVKRQKQNKNKQDEPNTNKADIKTKNKLDKDKNTDDVKIKTKTKEIFIDPVKIEKSRLAVEAKERREAAKAARLKEKKEYKSKPLSERIKLKFADNFRAKKKYSVKSGYAGIFAFAVAFAAISVVQPFISPKAKFNISMPEKIANFLTTTIEYTLVGSDSSVYGGYNGGMGGGFLYKSGGIKFKNKPILKITGTAKSKVIYLKGWTGTLYTGSMWHEADKKQIEEYNAITKNSSLPNFTYVSEKAFFEIFTRNMQDIFNITDFNRRGAELKTDRMKIEHLVSGGRLSFLPYFYDSYDGGLFNFKPNADLNVRITNSLFRYPVYSIDFYCVDNIMNRAMPQAVEDLKEYLDYYQAFTSSTADFQEYFSLLTPTELRTLMPDIKFYSEAGYSSMSNLVSEQMKSEGKFYKYNAPSAELEDVVDYHGYIFIQDKYKDTLDLITVFYNIYNMTGFVNRFPSDFILSEIVYNKFVHDNYLELYEEFPEEVIALAKEITEGLDTDYEKALAIEKYLAQNYTYTLNPHPPYNPKADFVYNFLFDQNEGYCTAYASAMITMLRSLGIPARYAEGYVVDTSKKQKDIDGRDFIIVHDYDGHAWPEVYLRGIGWIPFEPTVSYTEEVKEEKPYVYNPPARLPGSDMSMMPTESYEDDDEIIGRAQAATPISKSFYAGVAIILACAAVFLANKIIISNKFKRFKTAYTNIAVLKMLAYILVFLKHCGFVMHNEEGLKEFAKRVSPDFETIDPIGWTKVAEIMQKARYSRHEITETERAGVYEFIETLREESLKKLKFDLKFKLKYLYFIL